MNVQETVPLIPLRSRPDKGWGWQEKEASILFQPIIGQPAYALFCHLTGKYFGAPFTYSLGGLAEETGRSRATIWREMAVLKHMGMVRTKKGGGNKVSECSLVDLKKLAVHLGASYCRKLASYVLEPSRVEELRSEIAAMLVAMQVKHKGCQSPGILRLENPPDLSGTNVLLLEKERDARVSLERLQSSARETQMGPHLIWEERRITRIPTPTPSHSGEVQKRKGSSTRAKEARQIPVRERLTGATQEPENRFCNTSAHPALCPSNWCNVNYEPVSAARPVRHRRLRLRSSLQAGRPISDAEVKARESKLLIEDRKSYWMWLSTSEDFKRANPMKPPEGWHDGWEPTGGGAVNISGDSAT